MRDLVKDFLNTTRRQRRTIMATGGLCPPPGKKYVTKWHWRQLKSGRRVKVHTLPLVDEE